MRHCTWPFPDIRICYFENQKHHGHAPKKRTLILQVSGLISGPFPLQCLNSPDAAPFSFRIFLSPRGAETWWHLVTRGSGVMSPGVGRERIKRNGCGNGPRTPSGDPVFFKLVFGSTWWPRASSHKQGPSVSPWWQELGRRPGNPWLLERKKCVPSSRQRLCRLDAPRFRLPVMADLG